MLLLMIGALGAVVTILLSVVYKAYYRLPTVELKRRARRGDPTAVALYKAAGFGVSTKVLLAGLGVGSLYCCMYFLEEALPNAVAITITMIVIALCAYVLVSEAKTSQPMLRLAAIIAPGVAWVTERLNPVLNQIGRSAERRSRGVRTRLYNKADLLSLLATLKAQKDSDFKPGEIELAVHALTFGDRMVADVMIPKRAVVSVAITDTVGPVLMGELHKTGHSHFPVYETVADDSVVGILYLHDMVAHMDSRPVSEVMSSYIRYVHEDFTLLQTFRAFLKTKQHLFVVVNEFEEYVGIVTIEAVLEQMIGKSTTENLDNYDDLRTVASSAAHHQHLRK